MDGAFGTVSANHAFLFSGWLTGASEIAAEHGSTQSFCLSSLAGNFPPYYGSWTVQPVSSPSLPGACIPVWMEMCPGSGPKPVLLFLRQVSFVFPKQGRFSLLFSILQESLPSSLSSTRHKPWALRPFLLPLGFWRDFSCKIKLTHLLFRKHASTLCLGVWVLAKFCIFKTLANIYHISVEIKCSRCNDFRVSHPHSPAFFHALCSSEHDPDTIHLFSLYFLRFISWSIMDSNTKHRF